MLYLDSEDSSKPIYLYINCPGGSVIAGMALFDTMNHIKSKASRELGVGVVVGGGGLVRQSPISPPRPFQLTRW